MIIHVRVFDESDKVREYVVLMKNRKDIESISGQEAILSEGDEVVRREEQSQNILLKRTRYLWLKNPENLTIRQNETFRSLKDLRLKTLRACNIKLALRDFRNQDPHSGRKLEFNLPT